MVAFSKVGKAPRRRGVVPAGSAVDGATGRGHCGCDRGPVGDPVKAVLATDLADGRENPRLRRGWPSPAASSESGAITACITALKWKRSELEAGGSCLRLESLASAVTTQQLRRASPGRRRSRIDAERWRNAESTWGRFPASGCESVVRAVRGCERRLRDSDRDSLGLGDGAVTARDQR